ncbi:MAG: hypothetical protein K2Y04_12525, partial [Caulobacteraceae bacterium]|nr:hypothetical protein [Caulobacteraceae bacterium]
MSAGLGFEMAIENAYDLLRSVTCTGEVYSEGFGLNLRRRTDGPGEETYTLDSSSAKSRGIKTVFYCEDGKWLETHTTPDWETDPDLLDQLNSDSDVLVRTLDSPIHFQRGGDGAEGDHAVLDLLASLS